MKRLFGVNANKAAAKPRKFLNNALINRRKYSPSYQAEQERIKAVVEAAKEREA